MTAKDDSTAPSLKPTELINNTDDFNHIWKAKVITLFPDVFPGVLEKSLTGKALHNRLWELQTINLRLFGIGKHKDVDHPPAGGGAGMVIKPDVAAAALDHARIGTPLDQSRWPIIYMSPRGKPLTQDMIYSYSQAMGITVLCGRFEGLDERVIEEYNMLEVSIGDFVLTGGEIATQALIDATVRLLPNVLGNAQSLSEESFSNGLLEHPHYTKPAQWRGRKIPDILLSGHHNNVKKWRENKSKEITRKRRPDLWEKYHNNDKNNS